MYPRAPERDTAYLRKLLFDLDHRQHELRINPARTASKCTVRRNSMRDWKLGILVSRRCDISASQSTADPESVKA